MTNFSPSIGLETIQRAAFLRMYQHLNTSITEVSSYWDVSDAALNEFLDLPPTPIVVEPIAPNNFYEGHRPSLIKASIDHYPNISVYGIRATPHAESGSSDHTSIYNNVLYVEIMCKATDVEGEGIVNKRLLRTIEAANKVMLDDPSLQGVVTGMSEDVSLNVSDIFVRKEKTAYGPEWLWQGARLEYVLRKDSVIPGATVAGSDFASLPSGMTAADLATLDQT